MLKIKKYIPQIISNKKCTELCIFKNTVLSSEQLMKFSLGIKPYIF